MAHLEEAAFLEGVAQCPSLPHFAVSLSSCSAKGEHMSCAGYPLCLYNPYIVPFKASEYSRFQSSPPKTNPKSLSGTLLLSNPKP